MANVSESMNTLGGWMRDAVNLGLGLVGLALVVDVLFGPTTNIVANVGGVINQFTSGGLTGLVALIVFMVILGRR